MGFRKNHEQLCSKNTTQKDSNKHHTKCWKHYSYALTFTRNNNPVALRVSLVLRNTLGLEFITIANPFKEQSDIDVNVIAPVNWLHSCFSIQFLGSYTTLTLNKTFLSYICYRSVNAQDSIFSIYHPSSEELHVLCYHTLLHLQNVGFNQAPRKESINAGLRNGYKLIFNLLCHMLTHIDTPALSVRCNSKKKKNSKIIFWH